MFQSALFRAAQSLATEGQQAISDLPFAIATVDGAAQEPAHTEKPLPLSDKALAAHGLERDGSPGMPDDVLYTGDPLTVQRIDDLLSAAPVDLPELKYVCRRHGIPLARRGRVWRVLLGFESTDPGGSRLEYTALVSDLYAPVSAMAELGRTPDGPLGEDVALLRQIDVDVLRTHPTGFTNLFNALPLKLMLRRMLFVWSKTNKDVDYFQGLNEICTPFIIAFLHEALNGDISEKACLAADKERLGEVESDAYLGTPYSKLSTTKLHAEVMLRRIEDVVAYCDSALWKHLQRENVQLVQIMFRWVLCLMLRELPIKDALVVWDAALSDAVSPAQTFIFVAAALLLQFSAKLQELDQDSLYLYMRSLPVWWNEDYTKLLLGKATSLRLTCHPDEQEMSTTIQFL
eukprot:m51a1_g797 hypothetical protein (403) ;mRNA; f:647334-648887